MSASMWVSVIGAAGAVVAAAAAVSQAASARRSASDAKSTEARATEAIATLTAPFVATRGVYQRRDSNGRLGAYAAVNNNFDFEARDVKVEVVLRNGPTFRSERALLRRDNDPPLEVWLGGIKDPTAAGSEFLVVASIRIEFSDARNLARYERIEEYGHLSESPGVPIVTERRMHPNPGPFMRPPGMLG